jgi:hypothetical protein
MMKSLIFFLGLTNASLALAAPPSKDPKPVLGEVQTARLTGTANADLVVLGRPGGGIAVMDSTNWSVVWAHAAQPNDVAGTFSKFTGRYKVFSAPTGQRDRALEIEMCREPLAGSKPMVKTCVVALLWKTATGFALLAPDFTPLTTRAPQ